METNTPAKTREIERGINGSGDPVFFVVTSWTADSGRLMTAVEKFDTLAEAKNWIRWG